MIKNKKGVKEAHMLWFCIKEWKILSTWKSVKFWDEILSRHGYNLWKLINIRSFMKTNIALVFLLNALNSVEYKTFPEKR